MIADALTTLNMVRFELLKARKHLDLEDLQAHRSCLDALWNTYRLSRPHTRREDNKMPFADLPQPLLNPRHWDEGRHKVVPLLDDALRLHHQMQEGQLGWNMWNRLADLTLEALNTL